MNFTNLSKTIILFTLFLVCSCKKNEPVQPVSPTPNPVVTPQPTPIITIDKLKLISIKSSLFNTVDSNYNEYYASGNFNISLVFTRKANIRYKIYLNDDFQNTSQYLQYSSKVIPIPDSLTLNVKYHFNADSILSDPNLQRYPRLYFTIVCFDEDGNEISAFSNYDKVKSLIPISVEQSYRDKIYEFHFSATPLLGQDKNKNDMFTPFRSVKISISHLVKGVSRDCYVKVKYSLNTGTPTLDYGQSEIFNVSDKSLIYDMVINRLGDSLRTRPYDFSVHLYDAITDHLMSTNGFSYNIETFAEDERSYNLTELSIKPKDDFNNNTFPSSQLISMKVNTSDNITADYQLYIYCDNYVNGQYVNVIYKTIQSGQLYEILIPANKMLTKGYYNIRIVLNSDGRTLKTWDLNSNDILTAVKFESITEDQ